MAGPALRDGEVGGGPAGLLVCPLEDPGGPTALTTKTQGEESGGGEVWSTDLLPPTRSHLPPSWVKEAPCLSLTGGKEEEERPPLTGPADLSHWLELLLSEKQDQ